MGRLSPIKVQLECIFKDFNFQNCGLVEVSNLKIIFSCNAIFVILSKISFV